MLDVRRMQILREVVDSGSVTAAATRLGYTPSAVSQQVAALERQAGIALLERIGRGVRPTAAGRLLTERASAIDQQVAAAEMELAELRAGRGGRLSVRYFATAGAGLVAPAVARLHRDRPGIGLDLRLSDPGDPLPEVAQGQADLAVVVGRPGDVPDGVHLVHLLDDAYHLVVPKDHRLAAQRVAELATVAGERFVGSEPPGPCLDAMLTGCAAAGFVPEFAVPSEDYATAQGFVAAGLGIALIPEMGLRRRDPGVAVLRLRTPQPVRAVYAAVRRSSLGQPAIELLLGALRDTARGA
ncbi:LysR family transcriptional regulator [Hamadaea sp. NPDC051192]|uniref:LysR family transcriptional regulator n=1 Tax=Hamadaea sp. NPDC051192 TaxID=3154940 RepID=UPI0034351E63